MALVDAISPPPSQCQSTVLGDLENKNSQKDYSWTKKNILIYPLIMLLGYISIFNLTYLTLSLKSLEIKLN